jgi:hypothetical protein
VQTVELDCRCRWNGTPKFYPNGRTALLIGYAPNTKAYKLWDIVEHKIVISGNVSFEEPSKLKITPNSSVHETSANPAPYRCTEPSIPVANEATPSTTVITETTSPNETNDITENSQSLSETAVESTAEVPNNLRVQILE